MRKATPRYVSLLVKTSFKRGSYIKAAIRTVDNLKLILLDCDVIKWHYIFFFFFFSLFASVDVESIAIFFDYAKEIVLASFVNCHERKLTQFVEIQ